MLALPAAATAKPTDKDKRAAKQQCKAERGKSSATREAFRAKYDNFGRCVRRKAADEESETEAAHKNAAKECKAEKTADPAAFAQTYGTNANAYGKCVSSKAKAEKSEMDAEDEADAEAFKNAAHACAAERGQMGRLAFAGKYGTNADELNAFGKCVSGKNQEPRP